jgi:[CysO sulfur-carrier protein]-S-L-cysteine hydrolase
MDLEKHPWARDGVRIPKAVLDEIEAWSRDAYAGGIEKDGAHEGEEACGTIEGPEGDARLADRAVRLPNLANRYHAMDPADYPRTGRMYFLVDPLKFSRTVGAGETNGRPVKVLWHSHLDCGAYFSETDAATALAGGDTPAYDLAYLVVSVRGDGRGGGAHVDDRRLFVWDPAEKRFVDARLDVV